MPEQTAVIWADTSAATAGTRCPDRRLAQPRGSCHHAARVYVSRIREELERHIGGGLPVKPAGRGEGYVSYEPPVNPRDWEAFDMAQLRRAARAAKITTEMAAAAYREAASSPDPEQNRRPTAAAAEKLGVSRGHVSRLLTQARREGLADIGAARTPRKGGGK